MFNVLQLLCFFISINGFFLVPTLVEAAEVKATVRLNMVSWFSHMHETTKTDNNLRRKVLEDDQETELKLISGSYLGMGQYLVPLYVGTPPQKFMLIPDTGSDITWIKCQPRCQNCTRRRHRRHRHRNRQGHHRHLLEQEPEQKPKQVRFQARRSDTFKTIPCSSDICKIEPSALDCPKTPNTPCNYYITYGIPETLSAKGFLANETVIMEHLYGGNVSLGHVPIGCSTSWEGDTLDQADGVLGLGFNEGSSVRMILDLLGGYKFAYCLMDFWAPPTTSSYLVFGNHEFPKLPGMKEIELVPTDFFHGVRIMGISIDGEMLRIPSSVWDFNRGGGAILDSGSSTTILPSPAFHLVMDRLKPTLMKFPRIDIPGWDFCFDDTNGFHESMVPKLKIHFTNWVVFEPQVKGYVMQVGNGARCLMFEEIQFPDKAVIGNSLQQNHLWEYDLKDLVIRFAPSDCS